MTVGSRSLHHRVAQGLLFDTNFNTLTGTPCDGFKRDWGEQNGKNADFRPKNRYISETRDLGHIVTMDNLQDIAYLENGTNIMPY